MRKLRFAWLAAGALAILAGALIGPAGAIQAAQAPAGSHYFKETRHTVSGVFWTYWQSHGGLAQQGYPITEEFSEISQVDGKPYTVQYFERAVFELHPENAPPNNVLLTPLGSLLFKQRYPNGSPPGQQANPNGPVAFPQTGHSIGGGFATYWQQHGGLAQYGYPLTDEFAETSATDSKTYNVQYFERAVFEYHPDAPPGYKIMLSLLGSQAYHNRYETVVHPRAEQWPPAPGLAPADHPVLFNATFTGTESLSDWRVLGDPDEPPGWRVLNAHLQQDGDAVGEASPDDMVFAAGDPQWRDIRFEVQFFITSGDPVGVVWRAQDTSYYRLLLLPNLPNRAAKATLQLVNNGRVTTLASTPADRYAGYTPEKWQTIQVTAQGTHHQVSIDGVALLDVQDGTLAAGQIGLYAVEDQATAFDNIRVQQLGR